MSTSAPAIPSPALRPVRLPRPRGLVLLAVGLVTAEAGGWLVRVLDVPPPYVDALSMDAPWSLPRLLVALVFTVAAAVAWAGVGRRPGRRTWWSAIAVVLSLVAVVKAGSTIHVSAVRAIGGDSHPLRGLVVFGTSAALGLAWLYWLSRYERRDRRRVLTWLGIYGLAAIGLSTCSMVVQGWLGWASPLAATATFVEEAGEALASVGVLFAVLLGVAPRRVLPAGWAFRRAVDDLPAPAAGRAAPVPEPAVGQ